MKNKQFSPKHLLPFLFLLCGLQGQGQDQAKQKIIGVYPFTHDGNSSAANEYWSFASDALNNTGRFTLVDRSKWNVSDNELERQKGEEFIKSEDIVEQGRRFGANLVLQGHVQSGTYSDGTRYNQVLLQLIDVATNKIIGNEVITPDGKQAWTKVIKFEGGTPDMFKKNPETSIRKNMRLFIAEHFPFEVPVSEITKLDKNGNAEKVIVVCGEGDGIEKGVKLFVIERTLRHNPRTNQDEAMDAPVAQLKVEQVQGNSFSLCSVEKKSASAFTAKFNAKANIFVTDKDPNAK